MESLEWIIRRLSGECGGGKEDGHDRMPRLGFFLLHSHSLLLLDLLRPHYFYQSTRHILYFHIAMETAVKRFFSSPRFAVAGASTDPAKFGYKSTHFILVSSYFSLLTVSSPCLVPPALAASNTAQSAGSADLAPLACLRYSPLAGRTAVAHTDFAVGRDAAASHVAGAAGGALGWHPCSVVAARHVRRQRAGLCSPAL